MTTVLTPAPDVRDALLAAASLAANQPCRSKAIGAAQAFLAHYPPARAAWDEATRATERKLSVALVLGQEATCPADVARSLRDAAGGAL